MAKDGPKQSSGWTEKRLRRLPYERRRLGRPEIYFVTVCARQRRRILVNPALAAELSRSLRDASARRCWGVGGYVIMPDHIHLFCQPWPDQSSSLSSFIGSWKSWTNRFASRMGHPPPLWQEGFFDHLLRSSESYEQKWDYVRQNPVRAGLCLTPEEWPWQGEMEELAWAGTV